MRHATSVLMLCAALAGCAPHRPPAAPPVAEAMVADRLFLGRSIPGGGLVSEPEWEAFVREVLTPRFPDGLTLWRAEGQWRDARGEVMREPVMVVELIHPATARADSAVVQVAEEYRRRFRQEAVLRVTAPVRARLVR